jgi:hypothetical protein
MRRLLNSLLIFPLIATLSVVTGSSAFAVPCPEHDRVALHQHHDDDMGVVQFQVTQVDVTLAHMSHNQGMEQESPGLPVDQNCCQAGVGPCCGANSVTATGMANTIFPAITEMITISRAQDEFRTGMTYPPVPAPPKPLI